MKFIKLSLKLKRNLLIILAVIIWATCIGILGLTFYVNHFMPKGPMIQTDEEVCMNDDRGPCGLKIVEDTSKLDIPNWAKFFKSDNFLLPLIGLVVIGSIVSVKAKEIAKNKQK